jgi:hypothetical protein
MTAPKITGGTITGVTLTGNTLTNPVITGATLTTSAFNGTVGATTASTGAFTTLTSNGATTFTANTASTSTTTGTTVITGGLGVSGRINAANFDGIVGANTAAAGSFTTINASTSITNAGLTSGRVTYAGASGLLSDSSKLTFDTSNLTVGVTGLSANADGATGKLVLRKPNEASGNGQITRMLDFAPYYPGFDEAVVKASIFSGVDTGTQNGQIGFMTATGGVLSEKMRILADGSVGIGTSSPVQKLQVSSAAGNPATSGSAQNGITRLSNTTDNGVLDIGIKSGGTGAWLQSTDGGASGLANQYPLLLNPVGGNVGIGITNPAYKFHVNATFDHIHMTNPTTGTTGSDGFTLDCFGTSARLIQRESAPMEFYTGATERMRLDSSGSLLVGTTSSSFGGRVIVSNDGTTTQTSLSCINTNGSGTMRQIDFFTGTNTSRIGSIESTTTSTSFNTSSDYRLKENIVPMTGALEKIAQLKPVTYKWKINGSDGQGFIAHELQEVVPDCVTGKKDAVDAKGNPDYQGVDTSFLVATLTAAIQELKTEFDAYKATHP